MEYQFSPARTRRGATPEIMYGKTRRDAAPGIVGRRAGAQCSGLWRDWEMRGVTNESGVTPTFRRRGRSFHGIGRRASFS